MVSPPDIKKPLLVRRGFVGLIGIWIANYFLVK